MNDPTNLKEVHTVTGCMMDLWRFILQSSKRCIPFFQVIKNASKTSKINWIKHCQRRLSELKSFLSTPPILGKALSHVPLRVYLLASDVTIVTVLIKRVNGVKTPVYYISHRLHDAETRYPRVDKLVFSLVLASLKLRHYFQDWEIHVTTNQDLKRILHKLDIIGRLVFWTIILSQFYIEYRPRTVMKAQVFSDFVAECPFSTPQVESIESRR